MHHLTTSFNQCFPKTLVKEFVLKNQKELNQMWETEQYIKLPPFD